jgi:hypothetical protein
MENNYLVLIADFGLRIVPDYDGWNLNEYVDEYTKESLTIPLEVGEAIWNDMLKKFPNIEEDYKVVCIEDVNDEMEADILNYADELIAKYYGKVADNWALKELENLSEHKKDIESYKKSIYGFHGVSRKDFE